MRSLNSTHAPAQRPLVAGLTLALAASGALVPIQVTATARVVTNCLDSGSGSLRDMVTNHAQSGDTIAFGALLRCSTITLTSGEIAVNQNDLTIGGPGAGALAIDGGRHSRVFNHRGVGLLTIADLTITHGNYQLNYTSSAAVGGCLYSKSNIKLTRSTVSFCKAVGPGGARGGGIATTGGLYLLNSTVTGNQATSVYGGSYGGGAFVVGNLTVKYSSISNNFAATQGGGLFTFGNSHVQNSTLSGNTAAFAAAWAAPRIGANSAATISQSTISGNTASVQWSGVYTSAPLILSNSTIAFNQASGGGALYVSGYYASLNLQSSIIADNVSAGVANDLDGNGAPAIVGANDLITSSTISVPFNTVTACPKLAPLADNGGATWTHALLQGSPAIDQGNNTRGFENDQRGAGFTRMYPTSVDIGAYERQVETDDRLFVSRFERFCDD